MGMRRRLARALAESTLMHAEAASEVAEARSALRSGIASLEALRRLVGIGTEESLVEAVRKAVSERADGEGGRAQQARERAEAARQRAESRCEGLEKEVMALRQRPFTIELQSAERLREEAVEGRQAAEAEHAALRTFLEERWPEALQAYAEERERAG